MTKEMLESRKVEFGSQCPDGWNDYKIGWMAPDGSFYYTTCMEHLSFARSAASLLYGEADGDASLYRHGWLAIHPYGLGCDCLFTWRGHLTEEQKRAIKPFVEMNREWIADMTKRDLLYELDIDTDEETERDNFTYLGELEEKDGR